MRRACLVVLGLLVCGRAGAEPPAPPDLVELQCDGPAPTNDAHTVLQPLTVHAPPSQARHAPRRTAGVAMDDSFRVSRGTPLDASLPAMAAPPPEDNEIGKPEPERLLAGAMDDDTDDPESVADDAIMATPGSDWGWLATQVYNDELRDRRLRKQQQESADWRELAMPGGNVEPLAPGLGPSPGADPWRPDATGPTAPFAQPSPRRY